MKKKRGIRKVGKRRGKENTRRKPQIEGVPHPRGLAVVENVVNGGNLAMVHGSRGH